MNPRSYGRSAARRPRLRGARLLAPALALVVLVASAPAALAVKPPQIKIDYEKYTLPNGLEVTLREDHRLPIVAVNTWYHVGPANEAAGRTGFAHLFEHMMFQASGHVGEDQYWTYLEGAGSSLINGTTDFDRTNYMEDVPSNQLELALWLESDRMGYLQDRLTAASLANQQDVVRNERRQSVENAPYQIIEEEMWHMMYPKGHPYYAWVIGSHEDIQAAKIDDVKGFFKQYYTPNNASLVIVGDIDKAKTKALVQKYYGTIPRGPDVPAITATTPPLTSEKRAVVTDKVELSRVYFAWFTPPIFKAGDADAVISGNILGGGKASRLYKSLVYEKQIAQDVSASQQSLLLGSVFQVTITVKPGHTPDEVEKAAQEEIARYAAEGPTQVEIDAAQNSVYSGIVTNLENFGGFDGVANRLNLYNHFIKNPGYLNQDLARYAAVTPATAKKFAADYLKSDARVVVHGVPGDKKLTEGPPTPPKPEGNEAKVESAEPWRNTVPTAGVASKAALPTPKRFVLPNGLQVYVVESHNLPIVASRLVLRSGSAADPKEMPGLAAFTASMLDEGTEKMGALQIANKMYSLGATLDIGTSADGTSASTRSLKQNARSAMGVMGDVLLTPAFPAKEVDRVRNDRLTALLQQRDQPFQTAIRVMNASLYGPTHPYGHYGLGTEDALKKISRDDLVVFDKGSYAPKNAALVIVGDVTESEAKKLATDVFGAWKGDGGTAPLPSEGVTAQSRVIIVDKPGTPQTALLAGQVGVARSNPDYEKLEVMNTVLGGMFSSRINLNLREDKGYSYGAFSSIGQNRGVGPVMAGAAVRADATGPSVDEVLKEVTKMRDAGVTDEELRMAKDSMIRSLPANFETTINTAGTLSQIYMYDLPLNYYETYPDRVEAMTKEDVGTVAKKYLTPDRMLIVAVGDKKVIEPQISKLSLGTIAYRDADGKEIAASAASN